MAEDANKDQGIGPSSSPPASEKKDAVIQKKQQKGIVSRIWNGLFRIHGDDFEKRLQYISKEEASVLARMKRRSQNWRRMTRHLIALSVILEVIAVGYAIMTTRSLDLNWKMRAFRVLPMFLLPGLSSVAYSAFVSFTRLCDRKDQKTLERLRAERQAKIDELKEKTNYYTTQQLIQRYDTDPAAKAAAATVLASKLGADSGLKVYVGDESQLNAPTGKSSDVELVQSTGIRNRKLLPTGPNIPGYPAVHHTDELYPPARGEGHGTFEHDQLGEHHAPPGVAPPDEGWIARLAALLVGEDPTQSYALICRNCHRHNGLARREDFPYVTYYCRHCQTLNQSKQAEELASLSHSPKVGSVDEINNANAASSMSDSKLKSSSPVRTAPEIEEVVEKATPGNPVRERERE